MENYKKIYITDMHCDTIVKCKRKGIDIISNDMHIDLEKIKNTVSLQDFAIWLDKSYYNRAYDETMECIEFYYEQMKKNKDVIIPVYTYEDILNARKNNKIAALLSIEGGEAIEGSIEKLEKFYEKGVRLMTLTWNYKNDIGGGAGAWEYGISDFGKEVIKRMEYIGMIVDVSHLSDKSFWDVVNIAEKPFIASHSNSRSICSAKRNLNDDQIRALKEVGGVMGINLYSDFISDNDKCGIKDVMKHIDYIIENFGDDIIGFGCDYDGIERTPKGLENVSCLSKIVDEIVSRYGIETAEKIAWRNFDRIFSKIL